MNEQGSSSFILKEEPGIESNIATLSNSFAAPTNMLSFGGSSTDTAFPELYEIFEGGNVLRVGERSKLEVTRSEHATAEKRRRERVALQFMELSALVPGLKKV